MSQLVHSGCDAPVEVDRGKPVIVADGGVWYHCRCERCHKPLGILSDVESVVSAIDIQDQEKRKETRAETNRRPH